MNAYIDALQKYAVFSGRASRGQFWKFNLIQLLFIYLAALVDYHFGITPSDDGNILAGIVALFHFLPQLAVSVRRLHDIDRSGWWLLLAFTGIGVIVLLVFDCMRGTAGPNRFGPNPLAEEERYSGIGPEDRYLGAAPEGRAEPSFASRSGRQSSPMPAAHAGTPRGERMSEEPTRTSVIDEIERLAELKQRGILSEAEFEVMKARVLSRAG